MNNHNHNPIKKTIRNNPDHLDQLDRRSILPSWLVDEMNRPKSPSQPNLPEPIGHKPSDEPEPEPDDIRPVEPFDDLPEVMICPKCDGWRHWQSLEGTWHCVRCDPPTLGLAWLKRVERARRRHGQPIRPETRELIADLEDLLDSS
jgi:rubredoxin